MRSPFLALLLLGSSLSLAACDSSKQWFGSKDEADAATKATRIAILPGSEAISADPSLESMPVDIPPLTPSTVWTNIHGNLKGPETANILLEGFVAEEARKTNAGKGYGWNSNRIAAPVVSSHSVFSIDGKGFISARDRENIRAERWLYRGAAMKDYRNNGGGLVLDGEQTLIASLADGTVLALDTQTGAAKWQRQLNTPLRAAPTLAGDRILITTAGSQLFALNISSGKILWRHRGIEESIMISGGAAPAVQGNTIVATYPSGEIYAIDRLSGKTLWSDSLLNTNPISAIGTVTGNGGHPQIAGGMAFATSGNGLLTANALTSGMRVWEKEIASSQPPLISGHFVYAISKGGQLVCLHAPDGRVKWASSLTDSLKRADEDAPLQLRGPFMLNSALWVISSSGEWLTFAPQTGELLETRRSVIRKDALSEPAFAGSRAYITTQDGSLHEVK